VLLLNSFHNCVVQSPYSQLLLTCLTESYSTLRQRLRRTRTLGEGFTLLPTALTWSDNTD